jgi:hypothetical protein
MGGSIDFCELCYGDAIKAREQQVDSGGGVRVQRPVL